MTDAGTGSRDSAGRSLAKWWFWCVWPPLVALDLWSKAAVFGYLEAEYAFQPEVSRAHRVLTGDLLTFDLVAWRNTGTVWGLFQDGTVVLMVLRCGAVLGLLWFLLRVPSRARMQQAVMALIFAGAVGNLYDNFFCVGRGVRDFLSFSGTWPVAWSFPAFNIADSCITVGAALLFVLLWREDRKVARARSEERVD